MLSLYRKVFIYLLTLIIYLYTVPGVFSADHVDPGSEALAAALPATLKGHVIDLGAGWGYLADAVLARDGVTTLVLVESDVASIAPIHPQVFPAFADAPNVPSPSLCFDQFLFAFGA